MGKVDAYTSGRMDGLRMALYIVKQRGIEMTIREND